MAADASDPTRPCSPPVPLSARPPLLSDRANSTYSSQSIASVILETPHATPPRSSTVFSSSAPPSAYTRRYSGQPSLFAQDDDPRFDFLKSISIGKSDLSKAELTTADLAPSTTGFAKTNSVLDLGWELVHHSDAPDAVIKHSKSNPGKSSRPAQSGVMSIADHHHPQRVPSKKGGLFRRFTSSPPQQSAPVHDNVPPQLPQLAAMNMSKDRLSLGINSTFAALTDSPEQQQQQPPPPVQQRHSYQEQNGARHAPSPPHKDAPFALPIGASVANGQARQAPVSHAALPPGAGAPARPSKPHPPISSHPSPPLGASPAGGVPARPNGQAQAQSQQWPPPRQSSTTAASTAASTPASGFKVQGKPRLTEGVRVPNMNGGASTSPQQQQQQQQPAMGIRPSEPSRPGAKAAGSFSPPPPQQSRFDGPARPMASPPVPPPPRRESYGATEPGRPPANGSAPPPPAASQSPPVRPAPRLNQMGLRTAPTPPMTNGYHPSAAFDPKPTNSNGPAVIASPPVRSSSVRVGEIMPSSATRALPTAPQSPPTVQQRKVEPRSPPIHPPPSKVSETSAALQSVAGTWAKPAPAPTAAPAPPPAATHAPAPARAPPPAVAPVLASAPAPAPAVENKMRPTIIIPTKVNGSTPPPQPVSHSAPYSSGAGSAAPPSSQMSPPFRREEPAPVLRTAHPAASDLKSPVEIRGPGVPPAHDANNRYMERPPQANPAPTASHTNHAAAVGQGPAPSAYSSSTPQGQPRTKSAGGARRIAASPLGTPSSSRPASPPNRNRATRPVQSRYSTESPLPSNRTNSNGSTSSSGGAGPSAVPSSYIVNRLRKNPSSVIDRPYPRVRHEMTMTNLMSHPRVLISLLPHININTFLNLLGSDDELRQYITGEMVGRWVMREWGVSVDRERGRSWPGLTVWEGFLESLLHDPSVYSTYPQQYHNLLRHLSLSHTLIVLFLRTLPASSFPFTPPLPFDDDIMLPPLHKSTSGSSLRSGFRPGSRATSYAGSENGGRIKMPRHERITEVIMPEPLSAGPTNKNPMQDAFSINGTAGAKLKRRGSSGSVASVASGLFGRKRSVSVSSVATAALAAQPRERQPAAPMVQGKTGLPPVSYPSAKRYEFRRHGGGNGSLMSPTPSAPNSRPGSIMSVQTSPAARSRNGGGGMMRSASQSDLGHGSIGGDDLRAPPPIGGASAQDRSSYASSGGRSSRRSDTNSPVPRRDSPSQARAEPAFERPPPFMNGRAPILRVFVPVSDRVPTWPSAEGSAASWRELEKCGANKRMRLGDLVVNTALQRPSNTEHVLIYIPFTNDKLVPLEYVHSTTGHLPHQLDAFCVSPIYYDPFLPSPHIIYLDFAPYAQQAMSSLRLAYDRRDVTVASGARLSAKRYLHVAGIEVATGDRAAVEWQGMISLEAEGTAEGRADMEARFGQGDPKRCLMGPWEIVRERSMLGSLWLRLVREHRHQA